VKSLVKHLEGIRDWFKIRLAGDRCIVCHRLLLWHWPMRWSRCYDTPLPLTLTEQGWQWLRDRDAEEASANAHAREIDKLAG